MATAVQRARRRLREQDLAAVPGGGDTRDAVHVDSGVALVGDDGIAGVQADSHAHDMTPRPVVRDQPSLGDESRGGACVGVSEDRQQLVAVRIHLEPPFAATASRRIRRASPRSSA